jgi:hypothetical protein
MLILNIMNFETGKIDGINLGKKSVITFKDLLCEQLKGDYWFIADRTILPKERVFDERANGTAGTLWIRLLRSCDAYYVPEHVC